TPAPRARRGHLETRRPHHVIVGVDTPSSLRGRLERILADEPGVRVVDLAATDAVDVAAVHGPLPEAVVAVTVVALPVDPLAYLGDLLAAEAGDRSGTGSTVEVVSTTPGRPLDRGRAVTFPPPIGARWAHETDGRW